MTELAGAPSAGRGWARPRQCRRQRRACARRFATLAAKRSLRLDISNPRRRAALACGDGATFETPIAAKRRKEWARLKRRLMERGRLDFEWSGDPASIEDFLRLEAAGWKGARGTALKADPERAAFAREMLGGFASQRPPADRAALARRAHDRRRSGAAIRGARLSTGRRPTIRPMRRSRRACSSRSRCRPIFRPTAASRSPIPAPIRTIR